MIREKESREYPVRRMRADDLPSVSLLEKTCFSEPWSERTLESIWNSDLDTLWVICVPAEDRKDGVEEAAENCVGTAAENCAKPDTENGTTDETAEISGEPDPATGTAEEARRTGPVIGYLNYREIAGEGELDRVCVDPAYRGRGLGEKLLLAMLDHAKMRGVKDLTLEVRAGNVPAIALYEKYGFRTEGVRKNYYAHPTEDALILWKHE